MPLGRYGTILQVGDQEVPVLFTNEAIADAESRLGRSIMVIVQGFINGRSGVTEIGTILRSGMDAGRKAERIQGRTPTLSDAYKIMDEIGMSKVAEVIMPKVSEVISFGVEIKPDNDTDEGAEDEDPK